MIRSTREKDRVLFYSGKVSKGRLVPQFTDCNSVDGRKMHVLGSTRVGRQIVRGNQKRTFKPGTRVANGQKGRQAVTRIKNLRQQAEQPSNPTHSSESSNSTKTLLRNDEKQNGSKGDRTLGQVHFPGLQKLRLRLRLLNDDSLVSDGECKQHTHRARFHTCESSSWMRFSRRSRALFRALLGAPFTSTSSSQLFPSNWTPSATPLCGRFAAQSTLTGDPLTCFHVCISKICFFHAFCCSLLHLPIHTPSAQKSVAMVDKSSSTSRPVTSTKRDSDMTLSCLQLRPSAASTSTFLYAKCPRHAVPALSHKSKPTIVLENDFPPGTREPHIACILSRFLFCSQLRVQKTPLLDVTSPGPWEGCASACSSCPSLLPGLNRS